MNSFTKGEIYNLNVNYPWKNCINTSQLKENNKKYVLYATGHASIGSGREYISLPADKVLSKKDKIKFNLIN